MPVVRIDPAANRLLATYQGAGTGDAIRFGAGSLWISGGDPHADRSPF